MSQNLPSLSQEQHRIISECKKGLETTKLQLWQFKSELDSKLKILQKYEIKLSEAEQSYGNMANDLNILGRKLDQISLGFTKLHSKTLYDINDPTTLLEDLGVILGILFGYTDPSLSDIKNLLKDHKSFQNSLQGFAPYTIDSEQKEQVSQFRTKYPLSNLVNDDKTPEELQILISWIEVALLYSEKDFQLKKSLESLPKYAHKKQEAYFNAKEIEENIKDAEPKLERLVACIEEAESNIEKVEALKANGCSESRLEEAKMAWKRTEVTKTHLDCLLTEIVNEQGVEMLSGQSRNDESLEIESMAAVHNIPNDLKSELKQIMSNEPSISTNEIKVEPKPANEKENVSSSKPQVPIQTKPLRSKKKQGGCCGCFFGRK